MNYIDLYYAKAAYKLQVRKMEILYFKVSGFPFFALHKWNGNLIKNIGISFFLHLIVWIQLKSHYNCSNCNICFVQNDSAFKQQTSFFASCILFIIHLWLMLKFEIVALKCFCEFVKQFFWIIIKIIEIFNFLQNCLLTTA